MLKSENRYKEDLVVENSENKRRVNAERRLQDLKNYRKLKPMYVIGTIMVLGFVYFAYMNNFPEFMIYMFLAFPFLFWFFYYSQQWMLFGKKPKFIAEWESRQLQKYLEEPAKEKSTAKWK